jgi:hypothetical protein
VAKVAGIIKVAKLAGRVLGGVATVAGIYEGAKIVGNGVTAGLDALRTRNVPPPPAPPTGPTAVAGADELWTGASPDELWSVRSLADSARAIVGAAQCPEGDEVVSGPSYDCTDAGQEAHRQRLLRAGYAPDYVEARVAVVREYWGCVSTTREEAQELRAVYRLAINQLVSEGVPRREAAQAVLDAAVQAKRAEMQPAEEPSYADQAAEQTYYQPATYEQQVGPAYQFGLAPSSWDFTSQAQSASQAPAKAAPSPAKAAPSPAKAAPSPAKASPSSFGVFAKSASPTVAPRGGLPTLAITPQAQAAMNIKKNVKSWYGIQGADELWTGAAPGLFPRNLPASAPLSSPKLRELEKALADQERKVIEAETRLADYTKNPTVNVQRIRGYRKLDEFNSEPIYETVRLPLSQAVKNTSPSLVATYTVQAENRKRVLRDEVNAEKGKVATQKALVEAEKAFLRTKSDAAKAKASQDAQLAAQKSKEAATSKQLADTAAELQKKQAELEEQKKQAASDAEKAKLEAKIATLEAQTKNVAQLAAAPAETLQVAKQPSESSQIISSLLSALLQKPAPGTTPQQQAAAVAEQMSEGEIPAPEPQSEQMDESEIDDFFVSGYDGHVYGHDALGGACCEACASGHACEGDSCPVAKPCDGAEAMLAGDDAMAAPWTIHWASPAAPAWAEGIFAGGPGIPSGVSRDTCSTGSCRLPK